MQSTIHPDYGSIQVSCSCGQTFATGSTLGKNLSIEVCNHCHPFYSGKQKTIDTEGRVAGFNQKYGDQLFSDLLA